MERNENGKPIRQNADTGNNVIENFFEGEGCTDSKRSGGCQNPENAGCRGQHDGCKCTENGDTGMDFSADNFPLAYAYVPMQRWRRLYSPADGLRCGTLFEELNKPLGVYGNE